MKRRSVLAAGAATFAAQSVRAADSLPVDPSVLAAHVQFVAWATRRDLDLIRKLKPEEQTRELVSSFAGILPTLKHLYGADVFWFSRMKGTPVQGGKVPIPATFAELDAEWQKLFDEMIAWAKSRTPEQWRANVAVNDKRQVPLWQAVLHLSNHDSYHRGQLTTLIRQVGGTPVNTDLMAFYSEHFKA